MLESPPAADPNEAIFEIFLWVSWLWQAGQAGMRSAWEKLTIFSKTFPQSLQQYSYKGMA
jgi:hypothetical protein